MGSWSVKDMDIAEESTLLLSLKFTHVARYLGNYANLNYKKPRILH